MSAVKDPHGRPPLVEDPSFLDRLKDLDHGLDVRGPDADAAPAVPQPPRAARPRPATPEPIVAPPPTSNEPAIRHRPLIDLFPPNTLENERPPGPILGTAVGPQLPDGVVPRRLADT